MPQPGLEWWATAASPTPRAALTATTPHGPWGEVGTPGTMELKEGRAGRAEKAGLGPDSERSKQSLCPLKGLQGCHLPLLCAPQAPGVWTSQVEGPAGVPGGLLAEGNQDSYPRSQSLGRQDLGLLSGPCPRSAEVSWGAGTGQR